LHLVQQLLVKLFLKLKTLFFFLCLFGGYLSAQSPDADSTDILLHSATKDTLSVNRLITYAWKIYENQPDEAARLLDASIKLSRETGFRRGEAKARNAYGAVEETRGNMAAAKQQYLAALTLRRQLGYLNEIGASLNNLGVLSEMTGRLDSAIVYHRENLRIQKQLCDTLRMARALFNLAGAYQESGVYNDAQTYLQEARLILEARNDPDGTAKVYTQMGHIRFELELYKEALEWYRLSLGLREKINDPVHLAEAWSDYANALDELDSSKVAIKYYLKALEIWRKQDDQPGMAAVYTNLGDAYKHLGNYEEALRYLKNAVKIHLAMHDMSGLMEDYNIMGDIYYRAGDQVTSLEFVQKYFRIAQQNGDIKFIQSAYKDFAEVYAAKGDYSLAYDYRVKYDEIRYKYLNEKTSSEFARKEALFDDQRRQQQIDQQERELRIRDAELALQKAETEKAGAQRNALLGGALALGLLVALLFTRNRIRARSNRELAAKNRAIILERERADNLLRNILPEKTAEELKLHNTVQPVRYESVTVMFSDFVNFTQIAEQLSPEALIKSLDECFRLFDRIVEKHGIEKIKTIGDAYMCVGGLPEPNDTHATDVVAAAIEMTDELNALMEQYKTQGKPVYTMRIGIHTGPVVAGVVGSHKFVYDIWGDTVNTAARLEQGSEVGQINISATTWQLISHRYHCTFRGYLPAKNKGEIAMYYVVAQE